MLTFFLSGFIGAVVAFGMIQKFPVVPGRRAWVEKIGSYELPEGCREGTAVTIISHEKEERLVTVKDDEGRIWRLWHPHLDTGWRYLIDGQMYHESHPKARAYIAMRIEQIKSRPEHPAFPGSKQRNIDSMQAILDRVGVWTKAQIPAPQPDPSSEQG